MLEPAFSNTLLSPILVMEIQQVNTIDSSAYNFPMLRQQWEDDYAIWKDAKPEIRIPPSLFNYTDCKLSNLFNWISMCSL